MTSEDNEIDELRCSDCGRVLKEEEKGKRWGECQVCGDKICLDCMYYNRVKREGLFEYYNEVVRVCRKHRV